MKSHSVASSERKSLIKAGWHFGFPTPPPSVPGEQQVRSNKKLYMIKLCESAPGRPGIIKKNTKKGTAEQFKDK